MGKLKRMDQMKEILITYHNTKSIKGTARRLHISKNTVREYVRKALDYNADITKILLLSDEELATILYHTSTGLTTAREDVFNDQVSYWIKELTRVGITKHYLWQEYRENHANGYGYSQFCERLKRAIGTRNLTIKLYHTPGEKLQLDFAGKTLKWVDAKSGEVHDCQVLIAVMPYSQYTFVIALNSQKVEDFIYGINEAFLFFGKLPKVILSDNLKSFVIKSDKYEPSFNELCVQLSAHYQIDLQAARPRKPKDKASVENTVRTVYTRIYAPLRNEIYHSISELNEAIHVCLKVHNRMSFQKRSASRLSLFESHELPQMQVLPNELFDLRKSTKSKIQRNYHAYIGEDKHFYSVPYQYVGRPSVIIYSRYLVEIYIDNQRVASHARLQHRSAYAYQTDVNHMPVSHQEWRKARGYDEAYFMAQAEKIGPATRWAISRVLLSKIHQAQAYNSCTGILRLINKYSKERLEKACLRCQNVDKVNFTIIKNILLKNLDILHETPDHESTPDHENIRGPESYQ